MVMACIIFYLIIIIALGAIIASSPYTPIKRLKRASDKRKMKDAIRREQYYNQLYEECLYDEIDDMANATAKEMFDVDKFLNQF